MKKTKRTYLIVINLFIVITIIALAATFYLTLATATISVPGAQERFTSSATIGISKDGSDQSIQGTVVARQYTITESVPVGAVVTTSKKAGGLVRITNSYTRNQSLVASTRLMTADNKIFRISTAVTVPVGGSVTVFAEADQEGDDYLIGPSKFTIPGLWEGVQDKIYAESSSDMTYERHASANITQDMVDAGKNSIDEKILTQALTDFQKDYPELQNLSREQLFPKNTTVSTDPAIGTEASSVNITVTKTVATIMTDRVKLEDTLREKLIAQLPNPDAFIKVIPDTLSFTIAALDETNGIAQLDTKLDAWVHSKSSIPDVDLGNLAGKTKAQALDYLHQNGVTEATISTFPSWSPTLPLLKNHISVQAR